MGIQCSFKIAPNPPLIFGCLPELQILHKLQEYAYEGAKYYTALAYSFLKIYVFAGKHLTCLVYFGVFPVTFIIHNKIAYMEKRC